MTVVPATDLPKYQYVPETTEDLDWAELPTIDLTTFGTSSEADKKLATNLLDAIRTKGFFYVIGYDIEQDRVDRQFAIGQKFYDLPLSEKSKYIPDLENGEYNGYRPAGRRVTSAGLKDQVEVYNIPKFNGDYAHEHPAVVATNLKEIEVFARDLHSKVLDPLFDLVSIGLGLPRSFFRDLHKYENHSEDHLRYMKYSKYSPEDRAKVLAGDGLYSYGHTDLGSFTLLFRQPVAALQIKDHQTGEWKWAKPLDKSFTVNSCDAFSFLTGNYIKSTVHRVHLPPDDQAQYDRLGLLYFARPQNDLVLKTIASPVLKEAGFTQNEFEREGHPVPTMGEFVHLKQKWQQSKSTDYLAKKDQIIVPGFKGEYHH